MCLAELLNRQNVWPSWSFYFNREVGQVRQTKKLKMCNISDVDKCCGDENVKCVCVCVY